MNPSLSGIGIGREAATGQVLRFIRDPRVDEVRSSSLGGEAEVAALREAIEEAGHDVRAQAQDADSDTAAILEALLMVIEDDELIVMAMPHVEKGVDAASALFGALDDLHTLMGDDEDFQSRVGDLRGIARSISTRLRGLEATTTIPHTGEWVVVAEDLTPLDTAQFTDSVVGVVTEFGGPTSHTAIICRARNIPAVVSVTGAMDLTEGEWVLVDPAGHRVVEGADLSVATMPISFIPTLDEPLIIVRANIGSLADAQAAGETPARGVGLFRTEVLYLDRQSQPTMTEQASELAEVFRAAPAGTIIVRTIDAGSDKPVAFLPGKSEENPALGVRGFRLGRAHPEFQEDQLLAIKAAIDATGRHVQVMAPMISTVEEAQEFREMAKKAGLPEVGIMVETPAIVPMISDLAGIVDFVSIGSNDLSQYLFAADRQHPAMGGLVDPWQPGLLRTIDTIVQHASPAGIPVGVCGEAGSDPLLAIVLAGLGVSSVSAAPSAVAAVRDALSSLSKTQAQEIAGAVIVETSANRARDVATDALASASQ
ncbi:putative PEP-binding protein [Pontimonas sp.]|uniref:putative PEP-binding protein n=1 Tax=Pontimonas sp. TaxID=2304492 RepID=UPI0028701EC3|nr:putative PEP-binding protein [Pontimonas sp.]MDR9435062.1 putative PEP-binding protein [Pontimonas sp.]